MAATSIRSGDKIAHVDPEDRCTLFPILNPILWNLYKKHESTIWNAQEIDFNNDAREFKTLPTDVQRYIKGILSFFASSDLIINQSIEDGYLEKIKILEAKTFLVFQEMMENVHTETYSLLLEAYFPDIEERKRAQQSALESPVIAALINWLLRWIKKDPSLNMRVLLNAVYEGVLFPDKFCSIFWICKDGKLPALKQANEFISRDEGLHTMFSVTFYNNYIVERVPQEDFNQIIREAIELETNFINDVLPIALVEMNATEMIKYVKYCANLLAEYLLYAPPFPDVKEQPFPFMDAINVATKNNFFERQVTQYSRARVQDDVVDGNFLQTIKIDPKSPKYIETQSDTSTA